MVRRIFSIVGLVAMLVLLVGCGPAFAKGKIPTWTPVFPTNTLPENADGYVLWSLESFKDQLFASFSSSSGLTVYRSFDGTAWENVTPPGMSQNYDTSWDMQEFTGQLYLSANGVASGHPGGVFRTANGKDWETVFEGTQDLLKGNIFDKFGVYDGQIYLTTNSSAGQVWRSRTGNPDSWELASDGLGYPTSSVVGFHGDLYLSGSSSDTVKVWRSHDGKNWETLGAGVLDVPNNNQESGDLTLFKDQLYLSVQNYIDGGRLYRSQDGQHWELAVGQDFVGHKVSEAWSTMVYKDALYAFTNDTLSPACNGSCAKILRSYSGNPGDWELVNGETGWGTFSATCRNTQAIFKDRLYVANIIAFYQTGNKNAIYRMDP